MRANHAVSRAELYEKVWSIPMRTLAKELGLSDVGLAKVCRRSNIPTPGLGYWRLVETGHSPQREPLPEAGPHQVETITFSAREPKPYDPPRKCDLPPGPKVEVNANREITHPLAIATKRTFVPLTKDGNGWFQPRDGKSAHVRVSAKALPRALRIFDALFYAAETKGYSVSLEGTPNATLSIKVDGVGINFILEESFSRMPHSLTPEESARKKKNLYVYAPQWDYAPSGVFCLSIVNLPYEFEHFRRSWRDGKTRSVENCLSDCVAVLPYVARAMKFIYQERESKRKQEEAEEKRAEDLRRKRDEYNQKAKVAEQFVEKWTKSKAFNDLAGAISGMVENSELHDEQKKKLRMISD